MAIDLDEAFKRATLKFYEGGSFENFEKASGSKVKYSKEFFDEYEKGLRPKKSKVPEEDLEEEVEIDVE